MVPFERGIVEGVRCADHMMILKHGPVQCQFSCRYVVGTRALSCSGSSLRFGVVAAPSLTLPLPELVGCSIGHCSDRPLYAVIPVA